MPDHTEISLIEQSHGDDPSRVVPLRLQKFLARAGVASRRGSENLMTAGRVTVNGIVVTELGTRVDPRCDVVCVDDRQVFLEGTCVYLMLHKPHGYLTTMSDPQGRPTVAELIPHETYPGLFPVGRLDYDTTGLLLCMTDGELAHALLHPGHKVAKRYEVVVEGVFAQADADKLSRGIELDDGPTAPARIEIGAVTDGTTTVARRIDGTRVRETGKQTEVSCTITEGRKRQVKRMFSAVGHPVCSLHRAAFGPLVLGGLACGEYRLLTDDEIRALQAAVL